MAYDIEIKMASKNGWQTPAEARSTYGRYARDAYIAHWWGEPGKVGNHDQTVNYILGTANAGKMSVNYVVSNTKITMLVNPDNVSWGAGSGNPTGTNVEHDPTLNAEGYKRAGWLLNQLEERYGKSLVVKKHSDYMPTACPGTIDTARIRREADAFKRGGNMAAMNHNLGVWVYRTVYDREPENTAAANQWNGKDVEKVLAEQREKPEFLERRRKVQSYDGLVSKVKALEAELAAIPKGSDAEDAKKFRTIKELLK